MWFGKPVCRAPNIGWLSGLWHLCLNQHHPSVTCRRRDGPIGMEDGTTAFLAIASLRHGFAAIRRAGGFQTISAHTRAVTQCAVTLLFKHLVCAW